ncbi:MAG: hypothetical protein K2M46_04185 [Lachnospiraceae bacterium]|nr:hypothetical protein [Lachnospiraceae bacterium]
MITDFEYAEEKLSDYGMIVCNFNNSGMETVSSGADITFQQIKPGKSSKFHLYSSTYDSCYSATFQICRNPCSTASDGDMYLSPELVSALQRWLCRRNGYNRFKIYQNGLEHIYWNAAFNSKQIVLNGQIIGLELTMTTNAPYAYMDEVSARYECLAGTSFDFYDTSDEEGYIRPDVKIQMLSSGVFRLENSMDNKIMKISNCTIGEIITIDGQNQIITSSVPSHNISGDFNYFFPKIWNHYEKGGTNNLNIFTPSLDCNITITYSPIRKVGL